MLILKIRAPVGVQTLTLKIFLAHIILQYLM